MWLQAKPHGSVWLEVGECAYIILHSGCLGGPFTPIAPTCDVVTRQLWCTALAAPALRQRQHA